MHPSTFDLMQEMGHEQVVFCHDKQSGLSAIIAIHNTTLGSALGGTRLWNYASHQDAVVDALRTYMRQNGSVPIKTSNAF